MWKKLTTLEVATLRRQARLRLFFLVFFGTATFLGLLSKVGYRKWGTGSRTFEPISWDVWLTRAPWLLGGSLVLALFATFVRSRKGRVCLKCGKELGYSEKCECGGEVVELDEVKWE